MIALGAPVNFDMADVLNRVSAPLPDGRRGGYLKVWRVNRYLKPGEHPMSGVVVGVRTLCDGAATWDYSDEPIVFHPEQWFRAYLIAYDLRRKPVFLLPESVTVAS